jgi:uncharacterized protein (TIGR02466 family)|tara:strand:+ start:516 stop:1145 length:630 start_codon:yes stop_codon:yes gene_type:complete
VIEPNQIVLYPIFSKVIYVTKTAVDINKLLKAADKEKYHIAGDKNRYSNYSYSSINKEILNKKSFSFIKKEMINCVNKYSSEVMRYKNKMTMTRSWFTKAEPTQSAESHRHNNSFLSAVLYLKTDPDCGGLGFVDYSPKTIAPVIEEENRWNCSEYIFQPEDNLLIIFHSDMYHKILPNKSDKLRYSLAMNFMPEGEWGDPKTDGYCKI